MLNTLRHIGFLCPFLIWFAMPAPVSAQFGDNHVALEGLEKSSAAWGDYDGDGDLDVLLIGCTKLNENRDDCAEDGFSTQLYENQDGNFEREANATSLVDVANGDVDWGDYDNDGDLDILLTGRNTSFLPTSRIYRNEGDGVFKDIGAHLIDVYFSAAAWGDYDNDGDLDAMLIGRDTTSKRYTRLYRNNGDHSFGVMDNPFVNVDEGDLAWGDYDNDNDLDILLMGNDGNETGARHAHLYQNDGDDNFIPTNLPALLPSGLHQGSVSWGDFNSDGWLDILINGKQGNNFFTAVYQNNNRGADFDQIAIGSLPGTRLGESAWGDYNNDGDLDIALSGKGVQGDTVLIFENDGLGNFTAPTTLDGISEGGLAWGDYDKDGSLDLLVTGKSGNTSSLTRIYRNTANLSANNPPTGPESLNFPHVEGNTVDGYTVILSWPAGNDSETPAKGLSYNLRVGTQPGGSEIMGPMTGQDGIRNLPKPGNTSMNTGWTLKNLKNGTYYWSVQAIDNNFQGSSFASEGMFKIPGPQITLAEPLMPPAHMTTFEIKAEVTNVSPENTLDVYIEWKLNDARQCAIQMRPDQSGVINKTFVGPIPPPDSLITLTQCPVPPEHINGGDRISFSVVAKDSLQLTSTPDYSFIVRPGAPAFTALPLQKDAQTIKLQWQVAAADTSIKHFHLYRSLASQDTMKLVSLTQDNTVYLDERLSPGVTYFYRLKASNEGGSSIFSEEVAASLCFQQDPVAIAGPNEIAIRWKRHAACDVDRYEIMRNSSSLATVASTDTLVILADTTVLQASSYRYGITAITGLNAQITSNETHEVSPFEYPRTSNISTGFIEFGDHTRSKNYRMVGLPGADNIVLESTFSGRSGHDWNAFDDNGEPQNYLQAFDSDTTRFMFRAGKGFWIIRNEPWKVEQGVKSVRPQLKYTNGTGVYGYWIELQPGWNIISNPFFERVNWEQILKHNNNLSDNLWSYNGTRFLPATHLATYEGFYFHNTRSLDALFIPLPRSSVASKTGSKPIKAPHGTVLAVEALDNNKLAARVLAGLHPEASLTLDNFDQFAPPSSFEAVSLKWYNPEIERAHKWLATEYRPVSTEGQRYSMVLKGAAGKIIALSVTGLDAFEDQEVYLVDELTGRSINLHDRPEIQFNLSETALRFALLIGSSAFIADQEASLLPATYHLSQNYPNPFSLEVAFTFGIPKGQQNVPVKLEVYNLLGQRVARVVNHTYNAGLYKARWDGTDMNGFPVPSGVYIYRIAAGDWQASKTMVRVR